jgi:hypothetical protein
MAEGGLSERDLSLLTTAVMNHAEIKRLWWRWKKTDDLQGWVILRTFDGRFLRVTAAEVSDLLLRLADLADVGEDVKATTTAIFSQLKEGRGAY